MHLKNVFKVLSAVLLTATLFFIISGISGKGDAGEQEQFEADSKGMTSIIFNESNKKSLEVKCTESQRESEDKMIMHGLEAKIFKEGRLDKDILISGAKGEVGNNFHNFSITEKGRIESEDLFMTSPAFDLKDRAILTSNSPVNYKIKSLEGRASGMRMNLKHNLLFLYKTSGMYTREGKSFTFRTRELKFEDLKKTLRLQGNNRIESKDSRISANRMLIRFSEDYESVAEISAWGKCYVYLEDNIEAPGEEFKEIRAAHLKNLYDKEGNLKNSTVRQDVTIKLKGKSNTMDIASHLVKLLYAGDSGKIQHIRVPERGVVKSSGKSNFEVASNKMDVDYDDNGEISICKCRGNSDFKTDEYSGTTFIVRYYADTEMAELQGRDSEIKYKKNSFVSTNFEIDFQKKELEATTAVKSMVKMETKGLLFGREIIYINAGSVLISDKKGTFHYKGGVELRQQDISLAADRFNLEENNNILAEADTGKVALRFKNKDEEVVLKGKEIRFDAEKRIVTLKGGGRVESGENILKGDLLEVGFSKEDEVTEITGEGKIEFKKDTSISGNSEKVKWLFAREEIVFMDKAEIQRTGRGVTRGKLLRFFLKDNRIRVTSSDEKRTETVIEK